MRTRWFAAGGVGILSGAVLLYVFGRGVWAPIWIRARGRRTVEDVLREYGPAAERRLKPYFARLGVAYPPTRLTFVALKAERRIELWASNGAAWQRIRDYPILAASGGPGPKLRRGDRQVPEGVYRIEGLNPNSTYHLSMRLDYPNAFDRKHAAADGRADPGDDIFIHGKSASIGCLAMGDETITELFVLVARSGASNVAVIIAPNDLRTGPLRAEGREMPAWTTELYDQLRREMKPFIRPGPPETGNRQSVSR